MLKTYQFKTHCNGDSHSSKTANIILPGLVVKQMWTTLRLQAKWYSNSLNCALCWLKQLISPKLNSLSLLYFACRRKVVHLCFITSPGQMIFAVLELWLFNVRCWYVLEVTIRLELCTSYSSNCHHSPPPSSFAPIKSRIATFWYRLTRIVVENGGCRNTV